MSRCLHLTKQKLTYSDWNSEEVREEQISNIVCGGMFGGLHPMLSLPMVTHLEVREMGTRKGGSVTSHCRKLDNTEPFRALNPD